MFVPSILLCLWFDDELSSLCLLFLTLSASTLTVVEQEALQVVMAAQEIFPRVSLDLMYGRSSQSVSQWEDELLVCAVFFFFLQGHTVSCLMDPILCSLESFAWSECDLGICRCTSCPLSVAHGSVVSLCRSPPPPVLPSEVE